MSWIHRSGRRCSPPDVLTFNSIFNHTNTNKIHETCCFYSSIFWMPSLQPTVLCFESFPCGFFPSFTCSGVWGRALSVSHLSRLLSAEWPVILSPRTSDVCTCFYRTRSWTRTTPPLRSDKPERKAGSARHGLDPTTQSCLHFPRFLSDDEYVSEDT